MFKVRVIPCLDVKDGRVVKGVLDVEAGNDANLEHESSPYAAARALRISASAADASSRPS